MAATSHARGHEIVYDGNDWRYRDTGEIVGDAVRPCVTCRIAATPDGVDPCLGRIAGAIGACCGHGVEAGYVISKDGERRELPRVASVTANLSSPLQHDPAWLGREAQRPPHAPPPTSSSS